MFIPILQSYLSSFQYDSYTTRGAIIGGLGICIFDHRSAQLENICLKKTRGALGNYFGLRCAE